MECKKMIMRKMAAVILIFALVAACILPNHAEAAAGLDQATTQRLEAFIHEKMQEGHIPGMTVVVVRGKETAYLKSFGYANVDKQAAVTPETSFEIASCSKGFTALAVLQLQQQGLLKLDDPVSKYFPWFQAKYKHQNVEITLRQLLHHSSGIPWYTITDIPISNRVDSLEQVVRNVNGLELHNRPGERFEYATINYAIVGAVIQKVTGQPYEDYMKAHIFQPLGLHKTTLYPTEAAPTLATGYKNGFFQAREYQSPVFRGNRPAGYIMMDGNDLATWLKYQLGSLKSPMTPLIMETHAPDRTVAPSKFDMSSYAMGWADYQSGNGEVSKAGLNPNFSAYMVFRPQDQLAVGIMANNGTTLTYITGHGLMDILRDRQPVSPYEADQKTDNAWSVITIMLACYVLAVGVLLITVVRDIIRKQRVYKSLNPKKLLTWLVFLLCSTPFLYGVYLVPTAMQGVSWTTAIVWSPFSFPFAIGALGLGLLLSFVYLVLGTLFPNADETRRSLPLLVMMSLLSGAANAFVIFIVNFSIGSEIPLKYLLYYFGLALAVYIFGRKLIETKLVKITYNMIYRKRMELIQRVLHSSYDKLERMDNGKILATLNNDTEMVGFSANVAVGFATSLLTVICCFVYLGTISFWGTILSLVVIAVIAAFYSLVSGTANRYWEEARDTQNVYLGFIDHMLKGFKELSMHGRKKAEFGSDIQDSCEQYRQKRSVSRIKFTNALVLGETLLILILGVVTFVFPTIFPNIKDYTLIQFVVVFLYLIGPINGLLQAVPELFQIRTSWRRIKTFIAEMPTNDSGEVHDTASGVDEEVAVERIGFHNLSFEYSNVTGESSFVVGPITLEAAKGQIIFITGGNGSGKTTLAKLMTALYPPQTGYITINGEVIDPRTSGEYFSTVFSDFHLFERLYDIDYKEKQSDIVRYLKRLGLEDKVTVKDGYFSTLKLSGGQRKRLALLICYLENRPVYLFDEWAADQDPEFRKFFYHTLLPEMKAAGKIVFAITHDDHYFHTADRLLKMEMGQMKELEVLSAEVSGS